MKIIEISSGAFFLQNVSDWFTYACKQGTKKHIFFFLWFVIDLFKMFLEVFPFSNILYLYLSIFR